MADTNQDGSTTDFGRVKAVRKKTAEACERCREKRIKVSDLPQPIPRGSERTICTRLTRIVPVKCNGLQPCQQCINKDAHCIFAYAPSIIPSGNEEILESVLSYLGSIAIFDHLARKLELVLSRLGKIESEVAQQGHALSNLSRGSTYFLATH
jgi:hypothetical protein